MRSTIRPGGAAATAATAPPPRPCSPTSGPSTWRCPCISAPSYHLEGEAWDEGGSDQGAGIPGMLTALVGGDLEVIGEDDGPGGEFGLIHLLESPHRGGGGVRLVRLLVGELKKVDKLRRVAFLLPRCVDPGAGLMLGHVFDELHDGRLDLVHRTWVHLVMGGLINGHEHPPSLSSAAWWLAELGDLRQATTP